MKYGKGPQNQGSPDGNGSLEGALALTPLRRSPPVASRVAPTLGQLESHLWEAANILRGPVDAAARSSGTGKSGLAEALTAWMRSSADMRQELKSLLEGRS